MIRSPAISVVIPIYNVQDYLREAIDSVVAQTIGFEDTTELILVNDDSPDDSETICLEYKKKYPNNVKYIKQKNQGVCMARRNGFLKASGEYVHFLDSDDTISKDYYEQTIDFANEHKDEVDLVATEVWFFDNRSDGHYLNRRFSSTRVIDVEKEPTAIQNNIATAIVRRSVLKKEWFDGKLTIGEDSLLASLIVKQKRSYGVVKGPVYNYRIRKTGGSAINTQHNKRDYYTETPIRFWKRVLDEWQNEDGKISLYAQNLVFNDVQWRINEQKTQKILNEKDELTYKKTVYDIIARLDDKVIMNEHRLGLHKRIYLLKRKHGKGFKEKLSFSSGKYSLGGVVVFDIAKSSDYFGLVFDFITSKVGGKYFIEGYQTNDMIHPNGVVVIKTSRGEFPLKNVERVQRKKDAFLGDQFYEQEAFEATIEVADDDDISAIIKTFDGKSIGIPILPKRHTRIGGLNGSYRQIGEQVFRNQNGNLKVTGKDKTPWMKYELRFVVSVLKNVRLRDTLVLAKDALRQIKHFRSDSTTSVSSVFIDLVKPAAFFVRNVGLNSQSILLRVLYHTGVGASNKPIWILSDRGVAAGDNGEALFKYVASQKDSGVACYFAINKKSPDYRRMKAIGPVIHNNGLRYKLLFLRASKVISSHADDYVINPFGMRQPQLLDLYNFDYVFLQHGVTKNDISGWLNRFSKNIRIFVTVSKQEYNSILDYPFYYSKQEVLLSGFPRYDYLDNKPKNKIILAPTWRKYLTSEIVKKDGTRAHQDGFKESDYFNFYNDLINDERITTALAKAGMTGEFYLHPSHSEHANDFSGNEQFKIKEFPYDYKTAFREGNLLITDYSSVYFDFAYLKKPVVYAQFDRDYFFENHGVYEDGYFNEEKHGFGLVAYDYESTVTAIVESVKSGCQMSPKYQKRVDQFFAYNDKENSRRVYESIQRI